MNILKVISLLAIVMLMAGCAETHEATFISPPTEIKTTSPKVVNTPIPDERFINITYSHKVNDYVGMRKSGSSSGMTYLFVTMNIENHGYKSFNVNPYNWNVEIDKIQYNHHWVTYDLKDQLSTQNIMNGGKLIGSIAFEIPGNGTNPNNYQYSIVYDETFNDYNIKWNHNNI